jgi:hypothetical protein
MGILEEIRDILSAQSNARGKQYSTIVFCSGNGALIHLDFVKGNADNKNLGGQIVNVPYSPLFSLSITNGGPDVINVGTPEYENSMEAPITMTAGENSELKTPKATINYLNIVSRGTSGASVRIIGTV